MRFSTRQIFHCTRLEAETFVSWLPSWEVILDGCCWCCRWCYSSRLNKSICIATVVSMESLYVIMCQMLMKLWSTLLRVPRLVVTNLLSKSVRLERNELTHSFGWEWIPKEHLGIRTASLRTTSLFTVERCVGLDFGWFFWGIGALSTTAFSPKWFETSDVCWWMCGGLIWSAVIVIVIHSGVTVSHLIYWGTMIPSFSFTTVYIYICIYIYIYIYMYIQFSSGSALLSIDHEAVFPRNLCVSSFILV